jgi:eukaryotic-like serine/threonine-protein kinase
MSLVVDAVSVGQLAVRLSLVTDDQVRECMAELESRSAPAESLLRILERKGYLTPWQGSKLIKGDTDGYFLGGYRLLYKISAGTFGRVFRADDPQSGEIVAIKVLRRRWSDNSQKIDLFEREGKMGLAIRHPNIVSILAVNRDQKTGQYYIVMEFVEGGNLREILSMRKKLPPKEALRYLDEATTGLMYAYSKGMTHRDIKPSNILLSAQGVAKLVDFGLAELSGPITMNLDDDTEVDQSVDYAGLEQATGVKPGDIRSDVYFLGATLYQMLTGKPLLTITKDVRARKNKQRFNVIPLIDRNDPDVPPLLYSLITKMVAYDPVERYQTPSQLLDAIRNIRREIEGDQVVTTTAAPTGPKTVYVIEPMPKLQDAFREKLKEYGYRVLISIDAERAIQRYQQQPYHAIIVDVGTTGEGGITALNRVMKESHDLGMNCAGIVIFNEDQANLKEEIYEAEKVQIFVRPVTMKQITKTLNANVSGEGQS